MAREWVNISRRLAYIPSQVKESTRRKDGVEQVSKVMGMMEYEECTVKYTMVMIMYVEWTVEYA